MIRRYQQTSNTKTSPDSSIRFRSPGMSKAFIRFFMQSLRADLYDQPAGAVVADRVAADGEGGANLGGRGDKTVLRQRRECRRPAGDRDLEVKHGAVVGLRMHGFLSKRK